jgi:hypothetical protein
MEGKRPLYDTDNQLGTVLVRRGQEGDLKISFLAFFSFILFRKGY